MCLHFQSRIACMKERIRQLEDALRVLQAQHSADPHPLLRKDLLEASFKDQEPFAPPKASGVQSYDTDASGTLFILEDSIPRFFGFTGGSEIVHWCQCLLRSDIVGRQMGPSMVSDSTRGQKACGLSYQDFRTFSPVLWLAPMNRIAALNILIRGLPSWERACSLTRIYCEQAGWIFHTVSKDQIIDELIPMYYEPTEKLKVDPGEKHIHELALLFLVFAIGTLLDTTKDPSYVDAEYYHLRAQHTLYLQPILENPSLASVQTLHALSFYNALSRNEPSSVMETSMETTWSLVIVAAHLAQTIGLHRNGTKWNLPEKMIQRRRIIFWDLFIADAWHSLETGRPPFFSLASIDCQYPRCLNISKGGGMEPLSPFESWNYRFTECVAEVAAHTSTSKMPSYETIMELDRKVREFPTPETVRTISQTESMGYFVMSNAREVVLLFLHRYYFAQAILENPLNPLESRYGGSFRALYDASFKILQTIRTQYELYPELCARIWNIWTYDFSAAVALGIIATRASRSPFAHDANQEFQNACELFSDAAGHSRQARRALMILTRLRDKAREAQATSRHDGSSGPLEQAQQVDEEECVDELEIFAGLRAQIGSMKCFAESNT